MIRFGDIDGMIGADAVDADQDRLGEVGRVYLDAEDGRPLWAAVSSERFATGSVLVPLAGAEWDQGALRVAVTASVVREAPPVQPDAELTPEEQVRLHRHYGLPDTPGARGFEEEDPLGESGLTATGGSTPDLTAATAPADGPVAPGAESEQQPREAAEDRQADDHRGEDHRGQGHGGEGHGGDLDVADPQPDGRDGSASTAAAAEGTAPAGHRAGEPVADVAATARDDVRPAEVVQAPGRPGTRLRLRRVTVTEQVTLTVPVSHDEVRVEVVPEDEPDAPEDLEVVLTEQRPVLTVETVPVRRVRLGVEELAPGHPGGVEVRREGQPPA